MCQMEFLYFLLLCSVWPFRWLWQLCTSKKMPKNISSKDPVDICRESILGNIKGGLLYASSQDYTDMWTRDTFFASMGIANPGIFVDTLAKFQRQDGLIPLFVGRGNACCKMFCGQKDTGPIKATYTDVKTGDYPTDSCFQFIIMASKMYPEKCRAAWSFMQKHFLRKNDVLIHDNGLGTWQDTIKHYGHVAYTNILYYQATKVLWPDNPSKWMPIKKAIIHKLWTGSYFKCSTTNQSFGQVDNALAILYEIAPSPQSIIDIHQKYFNWKSPPNIMIPPTKPAFAWYQVYLPCYPIGNSEYHRSWAWSWPFLLMKKAIHYTTHKLDYSDISQAISQYSSLYETYDKDGPVYRVLYKSQPNFSEACGLFLDLVKKKISIDNFSVKF